MARRWNVCFTHPSFGLDPCPCPSPDAHPANTRGIRSEWRSYHVDLLKLNRAAWNKEVQSGNPWTRPVSPEVIAEARHGRWSLLLTPPEPVPAHRYPTHPRARLSLLRIPRMPASALWYSPLRGA